MSTRTAYLRRDPAEVVPWAETCGQIRCLVAERDGAASTRPTAQPQRHFPCESRIIQTVDPHGAGGG